MLEALERANLFLVPLDAERRWYRYHHLFADLLRARLGHTERERRAALHRRAGAWYAVAGLPAEAIPHALAAEDYPLVVGLIEQHAEPLWMRGELATVQRWLDAVPPAIRQDRVYLLLA